MDTSLTLGRFLRRFLGCTATGAVVVIFAKPLVVVALAVGVFAGIGFLIWLPFHAVFVGRPSAWQSCCGHGRRWLEPVEQKFRQATQTVRTFLEQATPVVSGMLLEGVSGALVAVVLAAAAGGHNKMVPAAALAGGLAGGLLGLTRSQ